MRGYIENEKGFEVLGVEVNVLFFYFLQIKNFVFRSLKTSTPQNLSLFYPRLLGHIESQVISCHQTGLCIDGGK